MGQIVAPQIPQLDVFELLPDTLIRVKFRRISWQLLQMDKRRAALRQKCFHFVTPMDRCAIPDRQQVRPDHPPQMAEEENALPARQGVVASHAEELPARRDATHHRPVVARQEPAQDRGLAARGVSADDPGQQVESRFINKDRRALLAGRFFFNAGQISPRQRAICSSSRWAARSIGLCGVQRNCFNSRPTWSLWYEMLNSRRISPATRWQVHSSPRKPYAWAPWDKNSGSRARCSAVSFGVAPAWGRERRPASPSSATRFIQRLTAPLVTPSASATSSCVQPSRLSSRARQRRRSFHSALWDFLTVMPTCL